MIFRKGQYMAIEAVLSIGLSLIVAVAAVTLFGDYRDTMLGEIGDRNVEVATSEMISGVYTLGTMDRGSSVHVELPETGQNSYSVSFGEDYLEIGFRGSSYRHPLKGIWASDLRGSAEGTSFDLVRIDDAVEVKSS